MSCKFILCSALIHNCYFTLGVFVGCNNWHSTLNKSIVSWGLDCQHQFKELLNVILNVQHLLEPISVLGKTQNDIGFDYSK